MATHPDATAGLAAALLEACCRLERERGTSGMLTAMLALLKERGPLNDPVLDERLRSLLDEPRPTRIKTLWGLLRLDAAPAIPPL